MRYLFSFIMLLACITAQAKGFSYTYKGQTLGYTILDEEAKTCEVHAGVYPTAGNHVSGVLSIPSEAKYGSDTYKVVGIGSCAFYGCSGLTSVTIPNSVTYINSYSFQGCSGLTSVVVPNSVTFVGARAFYGCSGLTSVVIGLKVEIIQSWAFRRCDNLKEFISLPHDAPQNRSDWTKEDPVFDNSAYENVTLVYDIGEYVAARYASSMVEWCMFKKREQRDLSTNIVISQTTGSIYVRQTLQLSATAWGIDSPVLTWSSLNSSVATVDNNGVVTGVGSGETDIVVAVQGHPESVAKCHVIVNKTSISISQTTADIYVGKTLSLRATVSGVDSPVLTWSSLKSSVATVDNKGVVTGVGAGETDIVVAVKGYPELTAKCHVKVKEMGPETYLQYSYNGNEATVTKFTEYTPSKVVIPEIIEHNNKKYTVTAIGKHAFDGCSSMNSVTIPNSVTSIGDWAFELCSSLTSVTIPNSVTSIGDGAFYKCTGLPSVTIPNSVTSIGNYMFYECSNLLSVTIPNSVTSIGICTFASCSSLTSVVIPNSVTCIGETAFYNCSNLTSVTISNSVTNIGASTFVGCSSLTSVTIPNSVTSIGDYAFCSCSGLTSVTIPNSVTSIGDWAFSYCSNLTSVTIPNSVTSIGDGAFFYCSALTSMTISNSVTSIGNQAFSGCSGLPSVTIPNSVTSIGSRAFERCDGLTAVTILNSVTSIGEYAFSYCSSLTSMDIGNSVTSIGDGAFLSCSSLTSVMIPNSVTSIGDYVFRSCTGLTAIYSANPTPPTTGNWCFDDSKYQDATLYVPYEAVEAYKTADEWKDFQNIQGFDPTGIESITTDGNSTKDVYYDINGRRLSAPKKGLNIINGKKMVIK